MNTRTGLVLAWTGEASFPAGGGMSGKEGQFHLLSLSLVALHHTRQELYHLSE